MGETKMRDSTEVRARLKELEKQTRQIERFVKSCKGEYFV